MKKIGMRVWVSGLVQGVFYRRFVQEEAIKLGIRGFACNLADGRVEILLCGEEENIEEMIKLLWEGPPRASVEKVYSEEVSWEDLKNFEIR